MSLFPSAKDFKAGPGVEKDAPRKTGVGRFFELVGRDMSSMYGVIDDKTGSTFTRTNLTQRAAPVVSGAVRTFAASATLPSTSKGWYLDLPVSGERIVQDAQVVSTYLLTASMVPLGDPCQPDGEGYINALDAFTGTSASGSYFDLNSDGASDKAPNNLAVGSIKMSNGMPTLPNLLRGLIVAGGTKGTLSTPKTLNPRWDRVSWREVRTD